MSHCCFLNVRMRGRFYEGMCRSESAPAWFLLKLYQTLGCLQLRRETAEGGIRKTQKRAEEISSALNWCGGMDSNHHEIAPASPSSWCVYQFRHHRVINLLNLLCIHRNPNQKRLCGGMELISLRPLSVNRKLVFRSIFSVQAESGREQGLAVPVEPA